MLLKLPAGVSVLKAEDPGCGTLLCTAVSTGIDDETVGLLIKMGANPNTKVGRFGILLNTACVEHKFSTIEACLQSSLGFRVLPVKGKYGTPMQSVVDGIQREGSESCMQALELLEKHGIIEDVPGGLHYTALHAATRLGAPKDVVIWLAS